MKQYFAPLPEYLARCANRVGLWVTILAGGVFLIVASAFGLDRVTVPVTMAIILVGALEAGYNAYREERVMRSKLEEHVRLTATLGSYAGNHPDPGPRRQSLAVHIYWEIWVGRDISTEKLGLNVIYQYDKPWWQFWRNTRFPKTGLPPKDKETTSYQRKILASDEQPFRDDAEFEFVADCPPGNESPHWLLELVLVVGMPAGEYRTAVALPSYDDLLARGTHPPL